jgi:hypothetical protein
MMMMIISEIIVVVEKVTMKWLGRSSNEMMMMKNENVVR